jgi:hypothetical protein
MKLVGWLFSLEGQEDIDILLRTRYGRVSVSWFIERDCIKYVMLSQK